MNKEIMITKAGGGTEPFAEEKLRKSLKEAEADDETIEEVIEHIKSEIDEGAKTQDIYKHAYSQLKRKGGPYAARYSLRESLSDLGPTGYPFEHFVAKILKAQGFDTTVGVHVEGDCVRHEVDVIGESDEAVTFVEAKFHNEHNIKSDVKTALYVQSRFNDIANGDYGSIDARDKSVSFQLITNTKFTKDAIDYGECTGLELVGWGYPNKHNLEELIYDAKLEPLTALTSLNKRQKNHLVREQELVLCKDLRDNKSALQAAGLTDKEMENVMNEVTELCHL